MLLVTGGAGFIGSNFVQAALATQGETLVNLDKLTFAGNLRNLQAVLDDSKHVFVRGDICDRALVRELLGRHRPRAIVNFAAESHVDRSIHAPDDFVRTNIVGTHGLLEEARAYWSSLAGDEKSAFRFLQVSTDEVYGSLSPERAPVDETAPYEPNSPYAASKAAADHLVRAYHHTYGLPTLLTNCSNNYGPYQFPEKLLPLMIRNALRGEPLPVYGDGLNVRDWLYVGDHCEALQLVLEKGTPGERYNIGGNSEKKNIDLVRTVCALLDEARPSGRSHSLLIKFVQDRPGHDRRYAIDASKMKRELGWAPRETLASGLKKTVDWYLANTAWMDEVASGEYRSWLHKNYGARSAA